jgi:hypothetical protein
MKDQVHAGRILRQIIHSEELHYGRACTTLALRIELANAHEHRGLFSRSWLPNSASDHCWKAVEVSHGKALPANKKRPATRCCRRRKVIAMIRCLFGIRKLANIPLPVNTFARLFFAAVHSPVQALIHSSNAHRFTIAQRV